MGLLARIYRLEKWSLYESPWEAPEVRHKRLVGLRDEDEGQVITSPIDKINGREVTTMSGSVYILGEIDPDYLQWMKDHGFTYDPDNPIKVHEQP